MLTIECTVNKCEYHRILPTHSYIYDIPNKNRYKTERIKRKRLTQKLPRKQHHQNFTDKIYTDTDTEIS